jgi:hypothetical protein
MANLPSYEEVFDYLRSDAYPEGLQPEDYARLLAALLSRQGWYAPDEALDELAYRLDDDQRRQLQRLAEAAARRTDASIAAEISEQSYHAQKARRFGAHNPERMDLPFWIFMVRRGWIAWQARMQFDTEGRRYSEQLQAYFAPDGSVVPGAPQPSYGYGPPLWCFSRFGMSHTRLPDGRALFIAGEHEDFYDPDFCIYNDVIVIGHDLQVQIYGYPEAAFPPTDFHTATLVGEHDLYIIGNLGYPEQRRPGGTPVFRLDTTTLQITEVPTSGEQPGWISRHTAAYLPDRHAIQVAGGQRYTERDGRQALRQNRSRYLLDLATLSWSRVRR